MIVISNDRVQITPRRDTTYKVIDDGPGRDWPGIIQLPYYRSGAVLLLGTFPVPSPSLVGRTDSFRLHELSEISVSTGKVSQDILYRIEYETSCAAHDSRSPLYLKFSFMAIANRLSCDPALLCCCIIFD